MKARLLLIAVVAFAAMAFSGSVCAQELEHLQEEYVESWREKLLEIRDESVWIGLSPMIEKLAELGDAKEQYLLGMMCLTGIGTLQNYKLALKWFALAAGQGYTAAQYMMGEMYMCGFGISQNYAEALKWYKLAADQGDVSSQYAIGCIYESGLGVDKNYSEALKWYKRAADQGDSKAKEGYDRLSSKVSALSAPATGSSARTSGTAAGSSTRTSGTTPPTSERTSGTTAASTASRASATGSSSSSSNTSGYSSYSSGGSSSYYSYKRPFNTLDEIHPVGISVGYVQKYWSFESESGSSTFGYWDDSENIKGVQAGLRIEPQFKYGFALDTGLYYEFYYSESKPQVSDDIRFRPSFEEHSLYLPVHLEYRLNFSDNFQIFIYGGVGLDYSLSDKIKSNSEDIYYEDEEAYDRAIWRKFNASYEAGAGIAVSRVQLNFTTAKSFLSMEDEADGVYRLNKGVSVSLSYMF